MINIESVKGKIRNLWKVYVRDNKYIGDLEFDNTIEVLVLLSEKMNL